MNPVVHVGYEWGSGLPVSMPLKHMVVTGQTQEAGKTTALEALISRSGRKALTFITKRGEASFQGSRTIRPYFREQADWQFVASILEASRGEKLKFERAWIIRASKGARTLADVQRNVRQALEKRSTGKDADVYTVLDAYLEVVVPTIARVDWAPALDMQDGVNAVDLRSLPREMQHLVIKSSLDWVLDREKHTIVVIPEAWKFIPEGHNAPSKLAASAYIRQGAALGNLLWLDSQDIGGISKEMLRSCVVWMLGVQREANEIDRTIENIPMGLVSVSKKALKTHIQGLGLGQFYVCAKATIKHVYVQPVWLSDEAAVKVARGELHADPMRRSPAPEADDMAYAQELADAERVITELRTVVDRLTRELAVLKSAGGIERADHPPPPKTHVAEPSLLDRPVLKRLEVDHTKYELNVTHRIEEIRASTDDLTGRLAFMISNGWFNEPKKQTTTATEMAKRGWSHDHRNVGKALDRLAEQGFVRIETDGYVAVPGMKVHVKTDVRSA